MRPPWGDCDTCKLTELYVKKQCTWNASGMPGGMYCCRLQAGTYFSQSQLEIITFSHQNTHLTKNSLMAQINPHINFNGNAEEAFNFYKSVFGGEFAKVTRLKDLSSPEFPVAEEDANKLLFIALPIGKNLLMANDIPESMGRVNENENRSKISISAESREEADKLFRGLSAGGSVEMPMEDSPWGSYFGMFRDKFGIEWMIDFDQKSH
jgi:PhnB protein